MRRYYRVILVGLLLIASLVWGLPLAWQQVLNEFQQYKKIKVHGREESVSSSFVYQMSADKWVTFNIPENSQQLRLISNLNIKPLAIPRTTAGELDQHWQYAVHYQLLDRQNRVLSEQRYHKSTRLTRYQDEQGLQFHGNYYYDSDLIPLDGRLAILSLKAFPTAVTIQLRLETLEPQVTDAVLRIYVPAKVAEHRIGTLWLRMNDKQKQALASDSVYPATLLKENEKLNLLRHQWRPLGPQGVLGRDYQARTLYALSDVGYEALEGQNYSTGLVVDAQQHLVIPIAGQGGRVFLDLKSLDQTSPDNVNISVRWFGARLQDRWQQEILLRGADTPIELPVQAGLLEVSSSAPLVLKAFLQEQSGAKKQEITPQLATAFSYYADSGLDYKIRHIDHQPAALRIDLRRITANTMAVQPAGIYYQYLDAQHQVLQQGELSAPTGISLYDRNKASDTPVQISDPQRYYFKLPDAVKYLRISAIQHDVLVSLYNQPLNILKQVSIPKLITMESDAPTSDLPSWFAMKPENAQSLMLNKLVQAMNVQPRPPVDDPYLVEGLYLWEDYLPERRVEARYILVPYEGTASREETLASLYCSLPVKQSFTARLQAHGAVRALNPELIFIRPREQAFDFSISQNQQYWVQAAAKGKQGVYYLPEINAGLHSLKLESSEPATWLMNFIADCHGAQYLKRRAFSLKAKRKLVFNVQHQAGFNETFSAKIFTVSGGTQHSKIKVNIIPVKANMAASYNYYSDWTFTQRVYDIRHQQAANSWILFANAQAVNSGESFFIPLNSDLPAGAYRIEIALQEGDAGFLSLSKLTPGIHAQRRFYSESIVDE
ncbi:MAG: hypothetical protein K9L22_03095 [Methylococcaceae bacterium]|nr:hypothetical protein [Methylococcaceae bacterium]